MNVPLNQEDFKDIFMHQDSMYKLVSNMAVLDAVKPMYYPLIYDKVALIASPTVDGSYMLTFYKEEFRSVKTFKSMVHKWM